MGSGKKQVGSPDYVTRTPGAGFMFIPLHDANTLKHIKVQWVTMALIALNVAVWLFTGVVASPSASQATIVGLGYIPAVAFHYATLEPALAFTPEPLTYITYSFVHSGFWHLASNMLFLWVFGDNVEDAMGHLRFLAFYLLCATAGALFHGLVGTTSEAPLVGASGAISGVVTAYVVLHPRVKVWVLVLMRVPLPLPAFVPLLLWIGQQFVMLLIEPDGSISWGHTSAASSPAACWSLSCAAAASLSLIEKSSRRRPSATGPSPTRQWSWRPVNSCARAFPGTSNNSNIDVNVNVIYSRDQFACLRHGSVVFGGKTRIHVAIRQSEQRRNAHFLGERVEGRTP